MSFSFADTEPALRYKTITTTTWGAGGNTKVITDPKITTNSQVEVWVTGTTPQAGSWAYNYAVGSLTLTSSSSENSALPLSYIIF